MMKLSKEVIQKKSKQSPMQKKATDAAFAIGLSIMQSKTKRIIATIVVISFLILAVIGIITPILILLN